MERQTRFKVGEFIEHLAQGGYYTPSKDLLDLFKTDPKSAVVLGKQEEKKRFEAAVRYAGYLRGKREGRSRYTPHQGKQEVHRRYIKLNWNPKSWS